LVGVAIDVDGLEPFSFQLEAPLENDPFLEDAARSLAFVEGALRTLLGAAKDATFGVVLPDAAGTVALATDRAGLESVLRRLGPVGDELRPRFNEPPGSGHSVLVVLERVEGTRAARLWLGPERMAACA
jgi:hypothetical protein